MSFSLKNTVTNCLIGLSRPQKNTKDAPSTTQNKLGRAKAFEGEDRLSQVRSFYNRHIFFIRSVAIHKALLCLPSHEKEYPQNKERIEKINTKRNHAILEKTKNEIQNMLKKFPQSADNTYICELKNVISDINCITGSGWIVASLEASVINIHQTL